MTSTLNKRQQARNERTLQELIKTVPGNDKCADCGARNPGWASWSLGIFLCMRCAAIHRKLGTHISKVKSLSMDKWDNEQVESMKRTGNLESNRHFNSRNVKANIPIDVDEVDSAMERFIRQKYEHKAFMNDSSPGTRHNTGSTSSVEDRPPPLPPKPGKRFGFGLRAASSTFPMSKTVTPPISPGLSDFREEASPPRVNKASRVFGSNVGASGDNIDSKLATLRDMGFTDEKRNATVLKSLNGNLDRAVEALIRLGDGSQGTTKEGTPVPPAKPSSNGLSFDRAPSTTQSSNPFDQLDAVAPIQQPQAMAPLQTQQMPGPVYATTTSPSNPYNPFLPPTQPVPFPQQSMEQSIQGLQLGNQTQQQQQQPLFPNRTGGYGNQNAQFQQTNPFQQSFTPPPVPQIPQQYSTFYSPPQNQQQQYRAQATPTSASNPFLRSVKSQAFSASNPFENQGASTSQGYQTPQAMQPSQNFQTFTQPYAQSANPFHTSVSQQPAQQNPYHQQQQQQGGPQQTHQQHQQPFNNTAFSQQPSNPWQQSQPQQQPQIQQQPQFQSQFQPQLHQSFNKNSILDLYNYPHLAPQRSDTTPTPTSDASAPHNASAPPGPGLKQRSVTMPISNPATAAQQHQQQHVGGPPAPGAMNPFAAMQNPGGGQQGNGMGGRHVSNESVDFAGLMGGRHSPDAFSGLSASFRR